MYDFDNAPQRLHTDSVKWDVKDGELPMWIADMDFQTAPEIVAAMQAKLQLGAFGYEEPHDTVAGWYARQHHAQPDTDWLILSTGVVPAISSIVRRVSNVGDNVLVQAPVYNIFYNSIENNGRHVLSSDLVYDGSQYSVDWTDLEAKLAQPLTTLMILCNPHNPVGKVWSESELTRIATLCQTHHVVMVADEIHGDLVLNGPDYTPAFSLPAPLNQNVISLVSPSKTFNVAAMHVATVIVPNADLRSVVNRGLNTDELAEPNLLAIPGTIAAYTKGDAWLASLKTKLNQNYQLAVDYLAANVPAIKVVQSTATYLMWLDVSAITDDADALTASIRKTTGLILSSGSVYRGNGQQFLRLNFACPTTMLQDGLKRLKQGVETFQS